MIKYNFQGVIENLTLSTDSPVSLPNGMITLTVDIENKPQAYTIPGTLLKSSVLFVLHMDSYNNNCDFLFNFKPCI